MPNDIVSGVGTRYGVVFVLDADGLPYQAVSSATPEVGVSIQGIKTATATDPEPQRFTHYGDDFPFAQDSLPPQTVESFALTTAKTNLELDSYLEGTGIRDYGILKARLANSNQRGNEPLVMAAFYRQALDTENGSPTFGKKRQWNIRIYPATRISPTTPGYEAGIVDNAYQGTPTNVDQTPWAETFQDESEWGASIGAHIEGSMDYQPRFNVYRGNGTLTSWNLTHTPYDSSNLKVWVNGSITVPGSITYGASPAFTIPGTVGNGTQILALIGTNNPTMADN